MHHWWTICKWEYLAEYPEKIIVPVDLDYEKDGKREEIDIEKLPAEEMFMI